MAASSDLTLVYERIDKTNELLSRLSAAVETNVALCKECRPKVLGNGKEGYDARLARLEEGQIERGRDRMATLETKLSVSRTFLMLAISAAGAAGALVGVIVQYFRG